MFSGKSSDKWIFSLLEDFLYWKNKIVNFKVGITRASEKLFIHGRSEYDGEFMSEIKSIILKFYFNTFFPKYECYRYRNKSTYTWY